MFLSLDPTEYLPNHRAKAPAALRNPCRAAYQPANPCAGVRPVRPSRPGAPGSDRSAPTPTASSGSRASSIAANASCCSRPLRERPGAVGDSVDLLAPGSIEEADAGQTARADRLDAKLSLTAPRTASDRDRRHSIATPTDSDGEEGPGDPPIRRVQDVGNSQASADGRRKHGKSKDAIAIPGNCYVLHVAARMSDLANHARPGCRERHTATLRTSSERNGYWTGGRWFWSKTWFSTTQRALSGPPRKEP